MGFANSAGQANVSRSGTFYPRIFYPNAANESEAKVIEVTEGSESANIDITLPESEQSRAISGRVINADTGQPAEGIEIAYNAMPDIGRYINYWKSNGGTSGANGEFRLKGMAPGKYRLIARPESENEFFSEPMTCDLSEGDVGGVEIKVRRGGSLSGVVVIEGTNDPKALAKLPELYIFLNVESSGSDAQRFDNPKINDDGSFQVRGLPQSYVHIQFDPKSNGHDFSLARIEHNGEVVRDEIRAGPGRHVTGVRVVLVYKGRQQSLALTEGGETMRRLFILSGCAFVLFMSMNPMASSQIDRDLDGVITGRVTTLTGEPMVGVRVSALMVKDLNGNPERRQSGERQRFTDDRGVYRIYGLRPGIYIVYARGDVTSSQISPYEGYAPTYHPSSPRETAAEVSVTKGSEATGVDIRYRGERGNAVSGLARRQDAPRNTGLSVALYEVSSGFMAGVQNLGQVEAQNAFTIKGITDGEYEIVARVHGTENDESHVSLPRRVKVRGADVGGIELKFAPLASVSGKVVVEASPDACEGGRKSSRNNIFVRFRPDTKAMTDTRRIRNFQSGGSVSEQGEFKASGLDPSRYFISLWLPDENWYYKSITAPVATAGRDSVGPVATYDVGRNGLALKSGDRVSGLVVTIANGAANLRGSLKAENESLRTPARTVVHLVPAEPAAADDVLRFAEVPAARNGAFEIKNIAPGKYHLLTRSAPNDEPNENPPAAWDAVERAKLRKEAEAMKVEIELKPCQRITDQIVKQY